MTALAGHDIRGGIAKTINWKYLIIKGENTGRQHQTHCFKTIALKMYTYLYTL